jgi:hypothetical protein
MREGEIYRTKRGSYREVMVVKISDGVVRFKYILKWGHGYPLTGRGYHEMSVKKFEDRYEHAGYRLGGKY